LPKRRVTPHKRILRDLPYPEWVKLNEQIHGAFISDPHNCGVCDKPPTFARRNDRDHDHETGLPRGLACGGDFGCNVMMPRKLTLTRARELAYFLNDGAGFALLADALEPYLPRDLTPERAEQIAAYLERVENFYGGSDG
jgi:hypothetical protein